MGIRVRIGSEVGGVTIGAMVQVGQTNTGQSSGEGWGGGYCLFPRFAMRVVRLGLECDAALGRCFESLLWPRKHFTARLGAKVCAACVSVTSVITLLGQLQKPRAPSKGAAILRRALRAMT